MMKEYAILCDVACDLSPELQQQYGIEVLEGYLTLPDQSECRSRAAWEPFAGAEDFYAALKKDPNGFATAPPNEQNFEDAFLAHVKAGRGVIALSLSAGMSGTYGFMCAARQRVLAAYPEAAVACIDTRRYSTAQGLLAVTAARLREQGTPFTETVRFLEENKNRLHQAGWLDDLTFLARKGRINSTAAFFGQLVGIKPIGEVDENGMTTVLYKAKGAKTAYAVLLAYIAATVEHPEEQTFFIAQTGRRKNAETYKAMIEERFHPKEIIISDVFPHTGVNVGPGLMAAYYFGKPISTGLTEEKEIFAKIGGEV